MAISTSDLLEKLLSDHKISPRELDNLLQAQILEDLYLEYKHGDELKSQKKARKTIRQYLSGFANSAGGILIIGIDEGSWSVTGCKAPGGHELTKWASDCLTPIAANFNPRPRFHVVNHPMGDVLVCATDRAWSLIPSVESGEIAYYFRFHDKTLDNKTLRGPDYLINDLLLGRRKFPYLVLTGCSLTELEIDQMPHQEVDGLNIDFRLCFRIENQGLEWADHVKAGVLSVIRHPHHHINNQLLYYVDVKDVDKGIYSGVCGLNHATSTGSDPVLIEPFIFKEFNTKRHSIPVRILNTWFDYTWKAALYIIAKDTPPIWYQINLKVDDALLKKAHSQNQIVSNGETFWYERKSVERPVVEWENLRSRQ
jgi:hypothetical protein